MPTLVLALAQIADAKSDMSKLAEQLLTRSVQLKSPDLSTTTARTAIDPANVVLACASLQHPALRSHGEQLLAALLDRTHEQPSAMVRPFLRKATRRRRAA